MKFISISEIEKENYKILSGSILPRPIAWITTLQENGKVNAAPFSYFSIVSAKPALLSVSIRYDTDKQKDTSRNILRDKEFVVHIISEEFVTQANKTSKSMSEEESELDYAGLQTIDSTIVSVPGIKEAKIRLECVYETHIPFENTDLIIGKVVGFHVEEELFHDGKIDVEKLNPVARLSGSRYTTLGNIIKMDKET